MHSVVFQGSSKLCTSGSCFTGIIPAGDFWEVAAAHLASPEQFKFQ